MASPVFLAQHPVPDLEALSAVPLLSVEGADWVWMIWTTFLREAGAPFHRLKIRRFNSYVLALQAARNGQGVALGWLSSVQPLLQSGKLSTVTEAEIADPNTAYVTWNDHRLLSPEAIVPRDWRLAQGH